MQPILIVEDDVDINNLLAAVLTRAGYTVHQAYSGTEAKLMLAAQEYALLMLDLMLPGMSGEELIAHVRSSSNVPVIILSAKDAGTDKVNLLRLGADDYMTKPFDDEELVARIEANLRRAGQQQNIGAPLLTHRHVQLNRDARTVTAHDKPVALTAREFDILELLMANPQKVFTKSNLYQSVWGIGFKMQE